MRVRVEVRPEQAELLNGIQREILAAQARFELAVEAMLAGQVLGGDVIGLEGNAVVVEVPDAVDS